MSSGLCRLVTVSLSIAALTVQARAAELRVTLEELTRLVQTVADNSSIYLNSTPGGLFASGSYIKIGSQKHDLPPLGKEFPKGGSTYAYHVKDISSTSVRVAAANRALRLTVTMEADGPEAIPTCVTGECPLLSFLPDVEWTRPSVAIDLVPVQFNGSISLQVKDVTIGGVPQPVCRSQSDFWAKAACNIGRAFANQSISKLKSELPKTIRDAVNDPAMQQRLADGLRTYLTVGQAGAVAINTIAIAPGTMTVNFKFSTANSGN